MWKRVALLALVVAGLGAYLYWWELPEAQRESTQASLVGMATDDITNVEIVFADRTLALGKKGSDWRLQAPLDVSADTAQVKSLLTSLTTAKIEKTIDELPTDLAAFGLDPPDPLVRITSADGARVELTIGRTSTIGNKTYVRVGDEPRLHLTQTNLRFSVDKQPKDLRDKQLLSFDDATVTRVEIRTPERTPVVLTRKDADAWTVDPGGYVVDLTELRSYLSSLNATRAVDFPAETPTDLARYGLDSPRLSVSVFTNGRTAAAGLDVGGTYQEGSQTHVYARASGATNVVGLGEWSLRSLDKGIDDFRDKTVLRFDPERVGRFTLTRAGEPAFTLVRAESGWSVDGDERALDQAAVGRFLSDLRDLKGSEIAAEPATDVAPFGLDDPQIRVDLIDRDGDPMGSVRASRHEDTYYAHLDGSPTVYETRDYLYTRLETTLDDLAAPARPTVSTD